jgi:hypothetical protein
MTRQSIEKMAASLKAMDARVPATPRLRRAPKYWAGEASAKTASPGHDEFRWGSDQL